LKHYASTLVLFIDYALFILLSIGFVETQGLLI